MLQAYNTFLLYRGDFFVVIGMVLGGCWLLRRKLPRREKHDWLPRPCLYGAVILLMGGELIAEWMARDRVADLQRIFAGFGPTYAYELMRDGHAEIGFDTSPDDPRYLRMIQTEKLWLSLNPTIADIYTFRKGTDGKIHFVVDSETDYNHDGKIDDDREARTPIGETYEEATPRFFEALEGKPVFDSAITSDRWGVWVSSFTPIYDQSSNVEAAVGIDYPAEAWVFAIARARAFSLGIVLVLVAILITSGVFIGQLRFEIAERQEALVRLAQASESAFAASAAKSEFLALMSHEVRTPLTAILGFANILNDSPLDPKQRRYVDTINCAGTALIELLNHILDYTRVESGKVTLQRVTWVPALLVHEVMELMSGRADQKGLQLHFENQLPGSLTLMGDPVHVRQILLNLVSNAVKFTARGHVTVRAEWLAGQDKPESSGTLTLKITDTGVGIPAEKIPTLYDAFAQADSSTTRRQGGTGLGLAICKRLSDMMGATIALHSVPKAGTTFTFKLPTESVAAPVAAGAHGNAPATAANPAPASLRALVVDDTKLNRELLKVMLKRLGVEADLAASGPEAISLAANKTYDIIFTDLEMPDMDGFATARAIREQGPAHRAIPIVAVSALTATGTREKCTGAGMDDYLTKPVYLPALKSALQAVHLAAAATGAPAGRNSKPTQVPVDVA